MKIEILKSFYFELKEYIDFIAKDKPQAARKFKEDILLEIHHLKKQPYAFKKSPHFDKDDIRELTFKGYTIIYRIVKSQKKIQVFSILKHRRHY